MVGNEGFIMKPKGQFIYPIAENEFMVSNHEKKKRLLYESVLTLIDIWTVILKNGGKRSFSYKTKASIHLSQWGEWVYDTQL